MNEQNPVVWPGWRTVRAIGRGSYGAVYEVEREILGDRETAAVKCMALPQNAAEADELLAMGYDEASVSAHYDNQLNDIVREYKLMAEMKGNSNIVSCEDIVFDRQPNGFGWDVRIKMELLTPLMKALDLARPEAQAVRLGKDMSKALILCKNRNIVHRDIKPQNIFVSADGDYKLGDFGIARTMEKTSGATKTGTYNYMAPEVYNNRPYGHQADIYSLGMVLYWLLNDRRGPFLPAPPAVPTASQQEEARLRRFGGEPLPPPAHGSEALKRVVLKACAFDPQERYAHAGELFNALEDLRSGSAPAGAGVPNGAQEKERIATPVTRSPARHDNVGADALGGPQSTAVPTPVCHPERSEGSSQTGSAPVIPSAEKNPPKTKGKDPSTPAAPPLRMTAETAAPAPAGAGVPSGPRRTAPTPVGAAISRPQTPPAPAKKKGKGALIGGILAVAVLAVVLLFALPKRSAINARAYEKDGITYTLDGTTLTISGTGVIVNIDEAIPDWDVQKQSIKSVVILQNSVIRIGVSAFSGCKNLEKVVIGEGLLGIGKFAFSDCSKLANISIPNSVTKIGDSAFVACSSLKEIVLPNKLSAIDESTFSGCKNLCEIEIPEGVASIGENAFYKCENLATVTIPKSVEEVGNSAFFQCTAIKNVYYSGTRNRWESILFGTGNTYLRNAEIQYAR